MHHTNRSLCTWTIILLSIVLSISFLMPRIAQSQAIWDREEYYKELRKRAERLRKAAANCRARIASGELRSCDVVVTFQDNRRISPNEAEILAAKLEREADREERKNCVGECERVAMDCAAKCREIVSEDIAGRCHQCCTASKLRCSYDCKNVFGYYAPLTFDCP